MNIDQAISSIESFEKEFSHNPRAASNPELAPAKQELDELKELLVQAKQDGITVTPEMQEKFNTLDFIMNSILKLV